jgi:photosystem II stability/assembly factor-like uncharacterized protein
MSRTNTALILALVLAGAFAIAPRAQQPQTTGAAAAAASEPVMLEEAFRAAYRWRSIGPTRGGRSIAVAGVKGRLKEAYFGATGGGLWKTIDGGENWSPVTDGQIRSSSVGAVDVAESKPDVVFIGMGESCIRGNVMSGDGVYKSVDAGKTWTHVGFRDARNISRIRIHPTNPDVVFVSAFGHHGAPNAERGVFKSTDGGKSWKKTLFRDDKTAAIDLSIDRRNPDVMYAALWEAYRVEYQMSSGGPGSGLFKSTDGGETWKEITRNPGLPAGTIGRIGVSVSGADSNRVYALVEHQNGGLFASDDAGATWKLVNDNRSIRQRAFYYTHVTADPKAKDTVYLLNTALFRSADGGKTLTSIGAGTHGDHHDLWIDPDDPKHLVVGNDGGGAVSMASGQGWTPQDFATPQYYHVATTTHVPYHVCGAQQDGSTVCLPGNSPSPAYGQGGAPPVQGRGAGGFGQGRGGGGGRGGGVAQPYGAGGSEPGYIAPDPKDPDVIFAGGNNGTFMTRLNRKTGQIREVNPEPRIYSGEPAGTLKERWQWTYPIVFSPVDPTILFTSSQRVWKTTNGGQSWEPISGDLTRHDPKTLGHSGGPITGDMNGPEIYATVFTLAPSKRDVNVIWAGSDDGLIHVTRDGGKAWINVTPKQMPEFGRVSLIDASAHDSGTAYAAVKRPLLDDVAPYIFRTSDYGATWTKIVDGIRADDYVHAIREDPARRGLLYAGTQHGIYLSLDDGTSWMPMSENLPDTPVSSIIVEENDLVIATHGRGFYILDDINAIRQVADVGSEQTYLFAPAAAVRSAGGATFAYFLGQPVQSLKLEVLDAKGQVINTITGRAPATGQAGRGRSAEASEGGRGRGRGGFDPGAPMTPGLHRVTWNLQYPGATTFEGMILWGASTAGPAAVPGTYQVRMTADGRTYTQPLLVKMHPLHTDVTPSDLQAQFDLAIRIRDKVSEANNAVIRIRSLKQQVAERVGTLTDAQLKAAADRLTRNLGAVEEEIYQVRNQSGQDPLNFPIRTNNRLAGLLRVVNYGDGRPIGKAQAILDDLVAELKGHTDRLQQVLSTDLPAFNAEAKRLNLQPVEHVRTEK